MWCHFHRYICLIFRHKEIYCGPNHQNLVRSRCNGKRESLSEQVKHDSCTGEMCFVRYKIFLQYLMNGDFFLLVSNDFASCFMLYYT